MTQSGHMTAYKCVSQFATSNFSLDIKARGADASSLQLWPTFTHVLNRFKGLN